MNKQKTKAINEREKKLIEFLHLTKEGKYAPIEQSSFDYTRFDDKYEEVEEELYFYNMA